MTEEVNTWFNKTALVSGQSADVELCDGAEGQLSGSRYFLTVRLSYPFLLENLLMFCRPRSRSTSWAMSRIIKNSSMFNILPNLQGG
ncbi:hypothetical protein [Methanogenium organophilum]|uniref:Uncharacterized protein n=1 Tax=Methanogenium organophilum TaxID=2199 RepID=A0A9X9T850_METOG|nr:hypothetical protein [Methanogenium organophilum]WAI01106.1 hypothetical protein OU421_11890 [Methanogenium organophilum]